MSAINVAWIIVPRDPGGGLARLGGDLIHTCSTRQDPGRLVFIDRPAH